VAFFHSRSNGYIIVASFFWNYVVSFPPVQIYITKTSLPDPHFEILCAQPKCRVG